ncbi:hypothetical protein IGX29_00655 [Streptomyces sp. H28]|uniref:hypothetical protein n=1 Tax=unclassified Streptomyces TaxID=2593676 RepID=UPI00177DF344|nr:hypothetical protein [Streptomyces sp. H28]MBD9730348.1 hypothetical protein [Streptomyces sp. H28]MBM7087202.1 hypothetical protein [Streptomyces sp. S12]
MILAALVHVLACAHGPTAGAVGRADSLLLASTTYGQVHEPAQMTDQQTAPAHNSGAHCCGMDEPTAQATRVIAVAVPAVHDAPAAEHLGAQLPPEAPALQFLALVPGLPSTGQTRACFGVWRT